MVEFDNYLSLDNKIINQFIKIPNVVCNSSISVNAKYLYGWIQNEIYFGGFMKSIEDINNILGCSSSTTRKVIKELQQHNFILVEIIKGNTRKITPLVNDSMIITEKKFVKDARHQESLEHLQEYIQESKLPQEFLDFVNAIK